MEYLTQYEALKNGILSNTTRRFNEREAMYTLMIIYALFHDLEIAQTEYGSLKIIPIQNDDIAQELRTYFIDTRSFRTFSVHDIDLLQRKSVRLNREQYKELVELVLGRLESTPFLNSSIYPQQLSVLFNHIVQKHEGRRIYNPFAGMASIAIAIGDYAESYIGQDIDAANHLISLIRLDAHYLLSHSKFELENSCSEWKGDESDVITSMMPWGVRVSYSRIPNDLSVYRPNTIEDLFYLRAFLHSPMAELVIGCSSVMFCSSPRSQKVRELLCEEKIVESIIKLPAILSNTTNSPYVIVLTPKQKHAFIRFINASEYTLSIESSKRPSLNVSEVVAALDDELHQNSFFVNYDRIRSEGYLLTPEFYEQDNKILELTEDNVRLSKLVQFETGEVCQQGESLVKLSAEDFSSDFYDICRKEAKTSVEINNERRGYRKFHGPCLVINRFSSSKLKIYWHRNNSTIACANCFVARLATNRVSYDYLIYALLHNKQLNEFVASSYSRELRISDLENFPIVIETSLQKQQALVESAIEAEYNARKAEFEADEKRLNIRKATSDLMHILGTPFTLQNKTIMRLRLYSGDKNLPEYVERVNALVSISSYISRIINAMNTDFANATYQMRSINLSNMVSSYVHQMKICDAIEYPIEWIDMQENVPVEADETMLQILMDCILENARRHGFEKQVKEGNRIGVLVENVLYHEHPFALLSICNNGKPLPNDITINEYISKGRYSEESGRTGLGGYHVYSIVKKHNGYIALRSDEQWSFIIDILIPLKGLETNNLYTQYDYEAI